MNFPIEFNNEVDEVKQSNNTSYDYAVDRLSTLAEGHQDISGAVVNLKQPSKGRETVSTYEVTIVVYMESEHNIVATEKSDDLKTTLKGALNAVERQVREHRKQQRNY